MKCNKKVQHEQKHNDDSSNKITNDYDVRQL